MRKKYLFLILSFAVSLTAWAENKRKVDSLENLVRTAPDTTKVQALQQLAWETKLYDTKKALAYANRGLDLANSINFKRGTALCHMALGEIYFRQSNFADALEHHRTAISILSEMKDKRRLAFAYNNAAGVFYYLGQYDSVTTYLFNALHIREEMNDTKNVADILSNLGIIYMELGRKTKTSGSNVNFEHSIENSLKAAAVYEKAGKLEGLSNCYNNIGNVYSAMENYTLCLSYYFRSRAISVQLNDKGALINANGNIGGVYLALGRDKNMPAYYDSSLACYTEVFRIAQELNSRKGLTTAYQGMGAIANLRGNNAKAIELLQQALKIGMEINSKEDIVLACGTLYKVYNEKGDYENALNYYRQRTEMQDSIFNDKKSSEFSEMNIKYETEKKQQENSLLKKTSMLKDEQLASEATKQKYLYGVVALILAFAVVLFIAFRNQQRNNKLLREQKSQIEEQKKEIIDSIHYAKRIQQSLLPTEKYLERIMKRYGKQDK
jgi:tetratricopeptide (TPR) repeat protein